ncbi:hypothetical protein BDN72DRAFT_49138 [Pluteus cervinus]|uniref:Uncharacterized protein n=1 Tax=Pluteus cervinus TaxID=181527 RepID=A0ACD3BJX4_9AGAR|nr:hypothetical protein BDN72DRAFT_49138 [Pluteus cervinus]
MDPTMVAFPAIHTSRHALMYTSLVYLTPQIMTLDFMIAYPSGAVHMPVEILLLIRRNLIPLIAELLVLHAQKALQNYGVKLSKSLCSDCFVYQHEVYGPDVWQWQQFRGACRCTGTTGMYLQLDDPPYFPSPACWLVNYLSSEVRRLRHSHTAHFANAIGDAVSAALLRYGYDLHVPTASGYAHEPLEWSDIHTRVLVVPRLQYGNPTMTDDLTQVDALLSSTLFHAKLDYSHPASSDGLDTSRVQLQPFSMLKYCHTVMPSTFFSTSTSDRMHTLLVLIAAPFTIPLMILTMLLTICFFYARPASFRIVYAG